MAFLSVEALKMFSLLLKRLLVHSGSAGLYSQLLAKLRQEIQLSLYLKFFKKFWECRVYP